MLKTRSTTALPYSGTESKLAHPGGMQGYQSVSGYQDEISFASYVAEDESFDQMTERGIRRDNDCSHSRSSVEWNPVTPATFTVSRYDKVNWPESYDQITSPVPAYYWWLKFPSTSSAPFGSNGMYGINQLSLPGSSFIEPLIQRSLDAMLPGIRAGLLSINSIIELKDFRSLPRLLQRFDFFQAKLPLWLKRSKKATLRELIRQGSETYLTYQFALKPLVSDICGLFDALTSFHQQVENLLRNAGKPHRSYYSCDVDDFFPVEQDQTVLYDRTYVRGGINCRRIVSYPDGKPRFRATTEYTYTLSEAQVANAQLYGLLDSLGVNLNPQIVWNAIPWSFAVDWVIGVNRWLGQYSRRLLEPRVNIHRYVWSCSARRKVECRMHFSPGESVSSEVLVMRAEQDAYCRYLASPDWTRSIAASGLNLKEFSFIAALIGARY